MPPENYKAYIQLEAIGGRKTRGAGAVILVEQQIKEGAYAIHRPDITPPVRAGASSRRSGFATAAGLCCASLGFVSIGSIRFPPAAKVPVVDAGGCLQPPKRVRDEQTLQTAEAWLLNPRRGLLALGGAEPGLPRYVGSKLSDAVSRGRKPITVSVKKACTPAYL
jgi:hypothetical protein